MSCRFVSCCSYLSLYSCMASTTSRGVQTDNQAMQIRSAGLPRQGGPQPLLSCRVLHCALGGHGYKEKIKAEHSIAFLLWLVFFLANVCRQSAPGAPWVLPVPSSSEKSPSFSSSRPITDSAKTSKEKLRSLNLRSLQFCTCSLSCNFGSW
jgi:hypothetical protein